MKKQDLASIISFDSFVDGSRVLKRTGPKAYSYVNVIGETIPVIIEENGKRRPTSISGEVIAVKKGVYLETEYLPSSVDIHLTYGDGSEILFSNDYPINKNFLVVPYIGPTSEFTDIGLTKASAIYLVKEVYDTLGYPNEGSEEVLYEDHEKWRKAMIPKYQEYLKYLLDTYGDELTPDEHFNQFTEKQEQEKINKQYTNESRQYSEKQD